jgi:SOS-response transcriptional repressor LexA
MSTDITSTGFSGSYSLGTRIRAARKSTGLNQAEFGKRLGVSQSAISNWESDTDKPSPPVVRQLAEMTSNADFIGEFLDASGIPRLMIGEMKSFRASDREVQTKEIVQLRDPNALGTPRVLEPSEVETVLHLPKTWFPIQTKIYAIRIDDDSMAPAIINGSLVFVDIAQRKLDALVDKFVVARIENSVVIRTLRKNRRFFLLPHAITTRYPVLPLESGLNQTILGEVVLWISQPQKRAYADLLMHCRIEIEELVSKLLREEQSSGIEALGNSVAKLLRKKQIDQTLAQLILNIHEIGNRAAHGIEITPDDVEQLAQFMPIIRSRLEELIQKIL